MKVRLVLISAKTWYNYVFIPENVHQITVVAITTQDLQQETIDSTYYTKVYTAKCGQMRKRGTDEMVRLRLCMYDGPIVLENRDKAKDGEVIARVLKLIRRHGANTD
ncbi:10751_t:CDS:2 [Paraglomus occultum]|uniref:10751_t:CDS:1 n=1 Tax=Paraglomus occultum TaxID=144539 RepID=A0A9N8Z0R0_9GLOM|nr:10751_t:CDS:2 [Paraglomus occultum]